jgi:acetylornithine deacetylase/succinyl-diaminopimelate desuccinylase-like protein
MSQRHLEDLFELLRFPSISTEPAAADHVAECASWLFNKLRSIGLTAGLFPTSGHPVVVAKNQHQPGRKTVLIYGHYDVQPVDPLDLWSTPPFEPLIENGRIYARGATDNKGQILAHILGVQEALEKGELPVNLIFLIEGEEEIGSPSLEQFLLEKREELRCDIVAISDTGMLAEGEPALTYGLRGIAALEVTVTGPETDLHSGIYGGAVANPALMLARMIATLHDEQGRVAVPGFYDGAEPLQDWEKNAWRTLPVNEERLRELTGVPELFGETGYTSVERIWARPTLEVNGIGGGFQGQGTKTVIPREAFAKITCRLVPGQEPERVVEAVKTHLLQICPPSVKISITGGHAGLPYRMDPNSAHGLAAQRALRQTFGCEPSLIREGGSIPIVQTFREVLGVDTLLLGLALPDCKAHAPNENFPVSNFLAGIQLNQNLLRELASTSSV